ncbi:MAG TPA: hypothetical protein VGC79_21805 [Polyangiaceae bacterium]
MAVFCIGSSSGLCGLPQIAQASPGLSESGEPQSQLLAQVEVAMIGDGARDALLFERIRSLFPAQTAVLLRDDPQLDQRAVLRPQHADTVYIWIRVTDRAQARVYLALTEQGGQTRYLFREVRLESGLDEVGGETLAQVAHSSARALWLREQQSSRQALVAALEQEPKAPRAAPAAVPVAPVAPVAVLPADSPQSVQPAAKGRLEPRPLRLGLGASGMMHSAGAEGCLSEVGGFLTLELRGRFSLRTAVRYLVPSDFDLPPARVHLNGVSGELRAGFLSNDARRMRVRIEAGLGVLWGRAQAGIVDDQPLAHALAAQRFERSYALVAAAFEWPLGPAWVAAGADLRVPLQTTSYEVAGQSGASKNSALCPGGSLEVGIGFDPALR